MVARHFTHVDTWVFDLDNTLYPPSADLFGLMDARFSAYVAHVTGLDKARARGLLAHLRINAGGVDGAS